MLIDTDYLDPSKDIFEGPDNRGYQVICADVDEVCFDGDERLVMQERIALRCLEDGLAYMMDQDEFNSKFTCEEDPTYDMFNRDVEVIESEYR